MTDQPDSEREIAGDPFAGAEEAAAIEAAELVRDGPTSTQPARPKPTPPRARPKGDVAATGRRRSTGAAGTAAKPDVTVLAGAATSGLAPLPDRVEAESIHISQGGISEAVATNVTVTQGGIGRVRATDVAVSRGGGGVARADRLSVEFGGIGAAMTNDFHLSQGVARTVLARDAHVEQSFVRSIVANRVTMGRQSGAGFVVARTVEGEVRTLLDWRGALAFGAAFGILVGLFRRRR